MPDEMIRTAGALPLPQHAALPTRGLPTALPINLSALMFAAGESIHVLDARGRVVWGNAQALHERSAAGMPDLGWRWERGWPAARRGAIHEAIELARSSGSSHVTMRDPGRMDGEHDRLVTLTRIAVPEDAGEYMIAISRDLDHGAAPVENGHRRGAVDGLTGLPDAGYFHRELARRVDDRQCLEHPFALVIIDFDDFKQINYRIGLERSDTMLVDFADRMEQAAGDAGFLARSSGDEFLLMLDTADRGTGTEGAVPIHDRVAAMVREVIGDISQEEVSSDLSASLGIAMFPRDTVDAQDLTRFAYTALRAAKASGKGRCVRFNGDMRQQMQNQLSMLEMARVAIASDWLRPYYQPKVDLHSGALVGLEALLRWKSPDGVVHFPASIAAAFDDPDIAAHISDLMLEKVLADMTVWQRTGSALPVAINASSADFRDRGFAEQFLARIAAAGLRPDLFELEVTEGVFLGAGASDVGVALQHLNAAGVRIALDDFGTGFAALSHLKQHPVDVIKIDRSFISNVTASPDDRAIVGAMVSLSRNLAIEVVAEGVETPDQVALLRDLGCQTGQGFLFGQAVPGAEVPDLLRRHCVDYPMSGTS